MEEVFEAVDVDFDAGAALLLVLAFVAPADLVAPAALVDFAGALLDAVDFVAMFACSFCARGPMPRQNV